MRAIRNSLAGIAWLLAVFDVASAVGARVPDRVAPVAADQQIPVEDFARPRLFDRPGLNPSGTFLAATSRNDRLDNVVIVQDLATGATKVTDRDIGAFTWFDDTHLLVGDPWKGAVEINRPGFLLPATTVVPSRKRGLIRETGFFSDWPEDHPPITSGEGGVIRVWGGIDDGIPAFLVAVDLDGKMTLFRREKGRWIASPVELDEIVPVAIGASPGEMIVIGPAAPNLPRALQRLDTITGTLGEVIYRDPEYDCTPNVALKRSTMQVIGVSVPTTVPRDVWFDERFKQVQELADKRFPGLCAQIVSGDINERRFLIRTGSDREDDAFHLLDFETGDFRLVKRVAPWLAPERMAAAQVFEYKARDGKPIEGFLTLPAGASKEHPVPAVVMVHEGPWNSRYVREFNRKVQFFASRGYAVFQPNYRGSEGYDSKFPTEDRFDFQKMANDIADGARAIASTGLVDPGREAVLGTDFGAYIAMCVAADEPDLFRCAILYDGVYDWEKLFREQDSATMLKDAWIQRRLEEAHLRPPSLMKRRDRIKTPLFLTRDNDSSTPALEAQIFEFHRAMRKSVTCELFADPNIVTGGDVFADEVERLDRIEAFLAKHCR